MDRCHLNVILHFLSICLMVALMLLLQIVHAGGEPGEEQLPVTDPLLVCGTGTAGHCPEHVPSCCLPGSVMAACFSLGSSL